MKEITVMSGKGGAGKTVISAALASVIKDAVLCDNDVDAPDLHLILSPDKKESHVFEGNYKAEIDIESCTACGICAENCRFDAIHLNKDGHYIVNEFQCEGCRLCERICPEQAITSEKSKNNSWFISNTRYGIMVHAQMGPGEENSGKLVTHIRKNAREKAAELNASFIINDGPPGIGCPAIAAITGTDIVLVVIEPSLSGLHDAQRLTELVKSFGIPVFAAINKSDLNNGITEKVKKYLSKEMILLLAEIPFSTEVLDSVANGKTITEHAPVSELSRQIFIAAEKLMQS